MPEQSKVFNYEADGLFYTVPLYEENGVFLADITVEEGAMDVNAIYFGDDNFSGSSASLSGPLNMNGSRLDGDRVQWDEAVALSDPGLGPEGEDKETYLSEGDTLTLSLDIDSLDDIDIFGVRATSTTTDAGSIKAVSDDPDEVEEPEDPSYDKVFFGSEFSDEGAPLGGTFILAQEPDPNTYNNLALPEGVEPSFENYVNFFLSDEVGGNLAEIESVVFYGTNDQGDPEELFRLDAPEGGFESADALLAAYDDAIGEGEEILPAPDAADGGEDLMAALALDEDSTEDAPEQVEEDTELDLV